MSTQKKRRKIKYERNGTCRSLSHYVWVRAAAKRSHPIAYYCCRCCHHHPIPFKREKWIQFALNKYWWKRAKLELHPWKAANSPSSTACRTSPFIIRWFWVCKLNGNGCQEPHRRKMTAAWYNRKSNTHSNNSCVCACLCHSTVCTLSRHTIYNSSRAQDDIRLLLLFVG